MPYFLRLITLVVHNDNKKKERRCSLKGTGGKESQGGAGQWFKPSYLGG